MAQNDVDVAAAGGGGQAAEQTAEQAEAAPAPVPEDFFERNVGLVEKMAAAVVENNVLRGRWSKATKEAAARGWKGKMTLTMETGSGAEDIDHVWAFINKGALVLQMLARDIRKERARADKAEAELAALRATLAGGAQSGGGGS